MPSQKQMERPVLGRELKNTELTNSQQFKKKKKFLITPFYFLNCAMRCMLIEGEILIFYKNQIYNSRFSFAHIVSN
jgi:hypothetical protein